MKLEKKPKYNGKFIKLENKKRSFDFVSAIGKIKSYLNTTFALDYADEMEEETKTSKHEDDIEVLNDEVLRIYNLQVKEISDYKYVIQLVKIGYTVTIGMDNLSPVEKNVFTKNLRVELFKLGYYCHQINSNALIAVNNNITLYDNDLDTPFTTTKVVDLEEYRNRKK